jgi:hypothetical protein
MRRLSLKNGKIHVRSGPGVLMTPGVCHRGVISMQQKRIIPRTCQYCGSAFLATRGDVKRGRAKFCSVDCRVKPRFVLLPKLLPWPERLWARVEKGEGCWLWIGLLNTHTGYGRITYRGKGEYAHRLAYLFAVGSIDPALEIDHLCHNADPECQGGACMHRRCVNPAHLQAVPHRVNALRGNGYYGLSARGLSPRLKVSRS